MSDSRKILYVSTNTDDFSNTNGLFSPEGYEDNEHVIGEGDLRGCIIRALQFPEEKYDIVFKQPPQEADKGHNIEGMGYWVIQLNKELPNIYTGDIRINYISPRTVTLTNPNYNETLGPQIFVPDQASSSMLVVGDVRHTGSGVAAATGAPNLEINGLNFVGHQTLGAAAATNGGGGGGGAAGAAILHIDGNLRITNTVFNHNQATGGIGARQAQGGVGFRNTSNDDKSCNNSGQTPTSGDSGGVGGQFATPTIRLDNNDGAAGLLSGRPGQPAGGSGGAAGKIFNGPVNGEAHGKAGSAGGSVNSLSQFGNGGGGGGGGGGRGRRRRYSYSTTCDVGSNGAGGAGGNGGVLGGNGAPGGQTTHDGTDGAKGRGVRFNPNTKGQNGESIGDAIAVIGGLFESANPILELENVDFYQGSGGNDFLGYLGNEPNVKQFNSNHYTGANNEKQEEIVYRVFNGQYETIESEIKGFRDTSAENIVPFLEASSSPINEEIAKVRPTTLQARDHISDVIYVDYEAADGNIGIYADLTDPDNELSKIWREAIPDETSEIRQELDTLQNATYVEHLLQGGEPKSTSQKIRDFGIQALEFGCNIKTGMKEECATGAGFLNEAADWYDNQARLQNDAQKRLDEATREQERLNEILSEQRAKIGSININQARNIVNIDNFRLGSDILILPYVEDRQILAIDASSGEFGAGVSLVFDNDMTRPFVNLFFDEDTRNAMGPVLSMTSLVTNLIGTTTLDPDQQNTWANAENRVSVLGTRFQSPIKVTDPNDLFRGPVSTDLYITRNNANSGVTIPVTTSFGNDQIIGTEGPERISTGDGNDIIMPGLRPTISNDDVIDEVNAGFGEDLVSYVAYKTPLNFVASTNQGFNQIEVQSKNSEGQDATVQAALRNVELIHAYGASTLNLNALEQTPGEIEAGKFVDIPKYRIISGNGSTIVGSKFDDDIQISYYEDYNWDTEVAPADDIARRDWYAQYSKIDGGDGDDALIIDLTDSPFLIKNDMAVSSKEGALGLVYKQLPSNEFKPFLTAQNIEEFVISVRNGGNLPELDKINQNLIVKVDNMKGEDFKGGYGDDYIELGRKGSSASGGKGNDVLIGESGSDNLNGNSGNDTLSGGAGPDFINGGSGNDELIGGKGRDIFHFSKGMDVVNDFRLSNGDQVGLNPRAQYDVIDVDDGTLIKVSDAKQMLLIDQDYDDFLAAGNDVITRISV